VQVKKFQGGTFREPVGGTTQEGFTRGWGGGAGGDAGCSAEIKMAFFFTKLMRDARRRSAAKERKERGTAGVRCKAPKIPGGGKVTKFIEKKQGSRDGKPKGIVFESKENTQLGKNHSDPTIERNQSSVQGKADDVNTVLWVVTRILRRETMQKSRGKKKKEQRSCDGHKGRARIS